MPVAEIVAVSDLEAFQSGDPQAALDDATAAVRSFCGWHVTPSITETVTGLRWVGPALMLPTLHLTSVASVTEDGAALVFATDFDWETPGYLTRSRATSRWPGPHLVSVTFTHGYAADSVEAADVASVIKALASRAQKSPDGVVRAQVGPISETYSQIGLLDYEKATLGRYRIPSRT